MNLLESKLDSIAAIAIDASLNSARIDHDAISSIEPLFEGYPQMRA